MNAWEVLGYYLAARPLFGVTDQEFALPKGKATTAKLKRFWGEVEHEVTQHGRRAEAYARGMGNAPGDTMTDAGRRALVAGLYADGLESREVLSRVLRLAAIIGDPEVRTWAKCAISKSALI